MTEGLTSSLLYYLKTCHRENKVGGKMASTLGLYARRKVEEKFFTWDVSETGTKG